MKHNKKKSFNSIALILLLTMSAAALIAASKPVNATTWPTIAYLSVRPNPIGVGQKLLVNVWAEPVLGNSPAGIPVGYNYTVVITKPDGTVDLHNIPQSETPGSAYFEMTPTQLGNYTFQLQIPGQTINFPANGDYYQASVSPKTTLVVQQAPIPAWNSAPLPDYYWTRPIAGENREWYTISGDWFQANYDPSRCNYNPYSLGPNSAHILWKQYIVPGGLVGGEYSSLAYYAGNAAVNPVNTILDGMAYYTFESNLHCIDVHSGQELWVKPISFSFGQVEAGAPYSVTQEANTLPSGGGALMPYLVTLSPNLLKYDAKTGNLAVNVTGTLTSGTVAWPYIFSYTGSGTTRRLIEWDARGSSTNFTSRIVYNVSAPWTFSPSTLTTSAQTGHLVAVSMANYPSQSSAVDLTAGTLLWNRTIPQEEQSVGGGSTTGDGKIYICAQGSVVNAYDVTTGQKAWTSDQMEYPWGTFYAYQNAFAYHMVYICSYAGLYAFDSSTGHTVWHYKTPSYGFENAIGSGAFWEGPVVADGKVYAATSEHSVSEPFPRGNSLYCVDAYNGNLVWTILGAESVRQGAIGDSVLVTGGEYDGCEYGFALGPTSTTVSAPQTAVPLGSTVVVQGTVMDQSPAQPGTPAISDDSMTAWMNFVHRQQAKPTDATGVQVTLSATDSSNNNVTIGTTTSDMSGLYAISWTPPSAGLYTITATFAGSKSYYSSSAETAMAVGPAVSNAPSANDVANQVVSQLPTPAPTVAPTPAPTLPSASDVANQVIMQLPSVSDTDIIVIVAVALAIIIGLVNLLMINTLRRRK